MFIYLQDRTLHDLEDKRSRWREEVTLLTGRPIGGAVTQDIALPTISPRKSLGLMALGMSAYMAYLYYVGFEETISALARVNLAIFSTAFILALVSMLFYARSWKTITDQLGYDVSITDIFHMYMSSIFLNNLIPSGSFSGETGRIYFLSKIAGNSRFDMSAATVAATRIITAMPFIAGMALGLAYLVLRYEIPLWALVVCLASMLVLLLVGLIFVGICFADTWLWGIAKLTIKYVEKIFHREVDQELCMDIVSKFHRNMNLLSGQNRALIVSTFWGVAGWLTINLVALVAFKSLDVEISIFTIFAVYAVVVVFQALPIILPGGVGLADIIMTALFNAVGIPMHDAAAVTILIRLVELWFLTFVGGLSTAHLMRRVNNNDNNGRAKKVTTKSF